MNIALVSFPVRDGDKEGNLRVIESVIEANAGPDLFLFPELSLCGMRPAGARWNRELLAGLAEPVPGGPSVARVEALARRHRTTLCAGIIEEEDGRYYITHFLCGPEGFAGKQRKLFPARGLPQVDDLSGGTLLCVHRLLGRRCVMLACADWMLPETMYLAGLHEAELILAPTDDYTVADATPAAGLALPRVLNAGATLVAVFGGHTPPGEVGMAGLILAPEEDPILLHETRRPGEVKVLRAEVTPQRPERGRWGSPRDRAPVLLANLAQWKA